MSQRSYEVQRRWFGTEPRRVQQLPKPEPDRPPLPAECADCGTPTDLHCVACGERTCRRCGEERSDEWLCFRCRS